MLSPIPQSRVRWADPRLKPAWAVLAIAAAVALALFPRTISITDESFYAGQALALVHGHLVPTTADALPLAPGRAAEAVRYPFGWPLLLAPFRLLGFRAMFLGALAVHLLGSAAAARMLVRRGLPAWMVAFFVFHPVAWMFSRSLMSDVPAVALLLVSMDQWEEGRPGRSAFALGYSLFSRMASLMPAIGVGLAVLSERRRWRDVAILALGPVVGGALLVAVNTWLMGNPVGAWYTREGVPLFTGREIPEQLLLYGIGLLALPPFPLACLLLRPRRCDRWALAAIPTLAFFLYYSYHDVSGSALETFLGGQRLILAAHAALIVATMRVWAEIPLLRFRTAVLAVAVAGATVAAVAWRRVLESRFLPAVQAVRACRAERVAFNELALPVVAAVRAREYLLVSNGAPPPNDVAVVSTRPVSRNPGASRRFTVPASWTARPVRCRQAGAFMVFDFANRCPAAGPPCALPATSAGQGRSGAAAGGE